jgi:choline dehydrogenase-like flavoprotein
MAGQGLERREVLRILALAAGASAAPGFVRWSFACGHGAPGLLQVRPAQYTPGWSLHETGTLRMGHDPKRFVTNRFGQTHDVANLFVCDASVFLGCSDKTTTLSILAFSLRTSEYLVEQLRTGVA